MLRSTFLILTISFLACTSRKERIPDSAPMRTKTDKVVIYQMMTRLFGNIKSVNRRYGTRDENGVGKFNDITPAALAGIKELGVTHIWYTGVIEHALLSDYTANGIPLDDADVVKGRAGSPYAIKDYYDVNPDLAVDVANRLAEFDALVQRTHDAGLKVIIDFVPNHVARKYQSDVKPEGIVDLGAEDDVSVAFKPSNNFYYLPGQSFTPPRGYVPLGDNEFPTKDGRFEEVPAKVTANDKFVATPSVDDWFEAVKLNYGVDVQKGTTHFDPIPNTWHKMRDILLYWSARSVDGFRCDMAEMVPVEFWNWVIPQIKEVNPQLIFIAEIYNPAQYRNYIRQGGFDYLYDKVELYDTLRRVIERGTGTAGIAKVQDGLRDISDRMLHFLENHDEQRIASRFFAGDPWKAVPAMTISATIDKGPVMIYFGQEVGEKGEGSEGFGDDDGRTTLFDYWGVPAHQAWMNNGKFDGALLTDEQRQLRQYYSDILQLARDNQAIAAGEYFDLTEYNQANGNMPESIHAFARFLGEERLVIVSGLNKQLQGINVTLPQELVQRMQLEDDVKYIGRDLLRSGMDIGLDENYTFHMEVMPFNSYVIKIKK